MLAKSLCAYLPIRSFVKEREEKVYWSSVMRENDNLKRLFVGSMWLMGYLGPRDAMYQSDFLRSFVLVFWPMEIFFPS